MELAKTERRVALASGRLGPALKRGLDIMVALIGLALIWPIWTLIALAIKLDSPGRVLLRQARVGLKGRHFTIYKFRTMVEDALRTERPLGDFTKMRFEPVSPLGRDPRVTRVGWFLRRSTLDESPQLINVLRGEMSLVGPRPEVQRIVDVYPPEYCSRHDVKPGMTGLAQIRGRSDVTYHQKMLYDLEYVRTRSLWLDLVILWRTIGLLISQRGAR